MNTQNLKYIDCDLYRIETHQDGKRYVHIDGYCYEGDNETGYMLVEAIGCFFTIDKVMEDPTYGELHFLCCNQTNEEMTEEEVCGYYDGADELPYNEITQDTPDGTYIDYDKKRV